MQGVRGLTSRESTTHLNPLYEADSFPDLREGGMSEDAWASEDYMNTNELYNSDDEITPHGSMEEKYGFSTEESGGSAPMYPEDAQLSDPEMEDSREYQDCLMLLLRMHTRHGLCRRGCWLV